MLAKLLAWAFWCAIWFAEGWAMAWAWSTT